MLVMFLSTYSGALFCTAVVAVFFSIKKANVAYSAGYRRVPEFESLGPNSALIFLTVLAEKEMNIIQQATLMFL